MDETDLHVDIVPAISEIAPEIWDACACPEAASGQRPIDPFTTHRFLAALERSRSVGAGTGWEPHHLVVRQGQDVIALAPLYVKGHSQGEYIFDHNWAEAWARSGGRYYPKLQIAVPFTPATGRRFLTRSGHEDEGRAALIHGAVKLAKQHGLSSLHATFCNKDEAKAGEEFGLLKRISQQFHWKNAAYESFEDFTHSLSSRKRKNIRKERQTAQGFGGKIIQLTCQDLRPEHWDAFWTFYQDTGNRKWGRPYLTRDFFDHIHNTMANDILLVMAERDGQLIAGALNFIGRDTLYGRYWGAREHHPCLHFELCYYQAIDYAIAHHMKCVEAGAQGDHKLARGYLPVPCYSLHWMADAGFHDAVSTYLRAERNAVDHEIDILTAYGPFKRTNISEDE